MARDFDGSADYISGSTPSGITNTTACTVSMWIKELSGGGALKGFLGFETAGGLSIVTAYFDGTRNGFLIQNAPAGRLSSKPSSFVTITNLNHLMIVNDGSNRPTLYINGVLNDTNAGATLDPWSNALHVGRGLDGTYYANCRIADFAVWDIALGATESAMLYAGYSPARIRAANLRTFWRLGIASPEPDWTREGNSGTLHNAPTISDHAPVQPPFGFNYGWRGAFTGPSVVIERPLSYLKNQAVNRASTY